MYSFERLHLLPMALHLSAARSLTISGWPWPQNIKELCPTGALKFLCILNQQKLDDVKIKVQTLYSTLDESSLSWTVPLKLQSMAAAAQFEFIVNLAMPSSLLWIDSSNNDLLRSDFSFYLRASSWVRKEALTRSVILLGSSVFPWVEEEYSIFNPEPDRKKPIPITEMSEEIASPLIPKTTLFTFDFEKRTPLLKKILPGIGTDSQMIPCSNSLRVTTFREDPQKEIEQYLALQSNHSSDFLITVEESLKRRPPIYINSELPMQYWRKIVDSVSDTTAKNNETCKTKLRTLFFTIKFQICYTFSSGNSWLSLLLGFAYNFILLICFEYILESPYVEPS